LKGKKKAQQDIKLPKGLNVTKADVKTKTIVVQNQLKKQPVADGGGGGGAGQAATAAAAITKKKLGLHDLLPKVSNLSTSTRVDGLEGLTELVQSHPEILDTNSSLILCKILPLLTEREGKVRTPAGKILQTIFQLMTGNGNGSSAMLEPLYDVISVHLCCALSHIDVSVQRGALRVLDTVIDRLPELVRRRSDQVLPNCLSQIAVKGGKLDSAMNDNVTSVQRRTEVIHRIVKLLQVLHNDGDKEESSTDEGSVVRVTFDHAEEAKGHYYPLFPGKLNDLKSIPNDGAKAKKGFRMDEFLEGMTPVLLDVWSECMVQGGGNNGGGRGVKKAAALQTENLEILCHVSESLALICKIAKAGKFKQRIVEEVLAKFPVVTNSSSEDEIVTLNMNLCSLYLTLNQGRGQEEESAAATATLIVDYVASILKAKRGDAKRHIGTVTRVALALDDDLELMDAGILSVNHPEVDRYVCQVIQRPRDGSGGSLESKRPDLIRHIAKAIFSKKAAFSKAHFEAVLLLVKRRDGDLTEAVVQMLDEKEDLTGVVISDEVCRTLALALKDAPDSSASKQKLRNHIQSLPSIDEYSRSFCVNTLMSSA